MKITVSSITYEKVCDEPMINSCWPDEINTNEVQDWDNFEIHLWSFDGGDYVEGWGEVKRVLENAGFALCKIIK